MKVPEIVGKTVGEANTALSGFDDVRWYRDGDQVYPSYGAEERVTEVNPPAGTDTSFASTIEVTIK